MVAALNQMTWGDAYDTVVILAGLGLIAMGIVRAIEWWQKRKRRRLAEARFNESIQTMQQAIDQMNKTLGTAMHGPLSAMADKLNAIAREFEAQTWPSGTVQNPTDPSPRPRRR